MQRMNISAGIEGMMNETTPTPTPHNVTSSRKTHHKSRNLNSLTEAEHALLKFLKNLGQVSVSEMEDLEEEYRHLWKEEKKYIYITSLLNWKEYG